MNRVYLEILIHIIHLFYTLLILGHIEKNVHSTILLLVFQVFVVLQYYYNEIVDKVAYKDLSNKIEYIFCHKKQTNLPIVGTLMFDSFISLY